ncbi:MAG: hypothetical protein GXY61_04950 [Lentisphaerae bacterium]|jgi:hypothetical protein|nr:hypothetical protein [Lentisphaerota bacterium]
MKNIAKSLLVAVFGAGFFSAAIAADVKEKGPENKRAVETLLKELGGDHWPEEGMKVAEVGAVETESTFYHVYRGYDKEAQTYRSIFFDNDGEYLGYYELSLEPIDTEEGALIFQLEDEEDMDDVDADKVPIPDKGPPGSIYIAYESAQFIKAPKKKEDVEQTTEVVVDPVEASAIADMNKISAIDDGPPEIVEEKKVAEYRDWTISWTYQNETTRKNETKLVSLNAKFVDLDNRTKSIIIMSAKNGKEAAVPFASLSQADKEYLSEFLKG